MPASTFVLALAGLWFSQTPPPGSPQSFEYINERAVKVPLRIDPSRRAEIKDILLYVSRDQGSNWELTTRATSEQTEMTFAVPVDGVYWLRLATVDRFGKQTPENPKTVEPSAKFVIDTLKPFLKIASAQRTGGDIVVAWEVREDNPSWESFRLEYMSAGSGFPVAVPSATPGLTGQARFTPNTNGPVTVRLTLRDKAGNESMTSAEVAGLDGVASATTLPAAGSLPPVPPPILNPIVSLPPTTPQNFVQPVQATIPATTESYGSKLPGVPDNVHFPQTPPRPFGGEPRTASNAARWNPMNSTPAPEPRPIASTNYPPPTNSVAQVQQVQATVPVITPPAAPRRPLPPLSYVNSPFVLLEYELSKVGPSGVGSVEIFYTENDGQAWELLAKDGAVVGKTSGGRHQGEIQLPQDGVYGFTLMVKSQAQLKQEALTEERRPHGPQPGDVPEIRVEVDTVAPTAELFPPRRDTAKPNALVLFWKASDKNLSNNPVTLEWAEHREGPWNPIASNLPNTGKHSWQLPDRLPVEVFLRLRVTDLASNEGVATTLQPITVDLSEPEGRLTNVSVSPRR